MRKKGDIIEVYSIKGKLLIESISDSLYFCKNLESGVKYAIAKDEKLIKDEI